MLDIYAENLDPSDRRAVDYLGQAAEDSPFSLFSLQIDSAVDSLLTPTADGASKPLVKLNFFTENGIPIDLETSFDFISDQEAAGSAAGNENTAYCTKTASLHSFEQLTDHAPFPVAFLCPSQEVTRLALSPTIEDVIKAYLQSKNDSDHLLAKEFVSKLMGWLDPRCTSEGCRATAARAVIHYATRTRRSELWMKAVRTSRVSIVALNQEDVKKAHKVFSGPVWEELYVDLGLSEACFVFTFSPSLTVSKCQRMPDKRPIQCFTTIDDYRCRTGFRAHPTTPAGNCLPPDEICAELP